MRALTDPFPRRRTSVWGSFRKDEWIPLRFGPIARGRCVQYQTGDRDQVPGSLWCWSDGACAGIDAVYVDGRLRTGGWVARVQSDVTGKPVTLIEFTTPVDQDAIVTADGRGQVENGAMIRNPARVIARLSAIADVPADGMEVFEAECRALGIEVGGELAEDVTVQGAIRDLCKSVGAIYSPRMRGKAVVYPGGLPALVNAAPRIRAAVDASNLTAWSANADAVINALSVSYALRDGSASKVMELECPASIAVFGRRASVIAAPWVVDDGVMANIATRLIAFSARAAAEVSVTGIRGEIRPGDWIDVDGARSILPAATGARQLIASEYDPETEATAGVFQLWPDPIPTVVIVSTAVISEDQQAVKTEQKTVGSQRQITLTGAGGLPLANRRVILDGAVTRFSNGAGIVTFPLADTPPGEHVLEISMTETVSTAGASVDAGEFGQFTIPGQEIPVDTTIRISIYFS